ncbi:MAG TPA: NAD(P)H-dependent oxidoreductase [Xanthomonadales bacterium]|nr:NAD(P)H-dependent oxidoreductase [Xanthomonadales bacterium]
MGKLPSSRATPDVRKGQGDVTLDREEFGKRFRARWFDPAFDGERESLERLEQLAYEVYEAHRKAPRTRKAGEGFADPGYDLSIEWLAARDAVLAAQREHEDLARAPRVLLVCAASRSDETCPGEMSKTFRLCEAIQQELAHASATCDFLDLSHLASQRDRMIYPCKACVSTAMPLCHWPCSCYPNHSLGQVNDWMNELYPRFVAAHGILVVTPVYWYQAPANLKLLIDRLVCADGGNPDPTSTQGKDPARAKRIELDGWDYPRHLAGRAYGVVVHGDTEGADTVRRSLCDWLDEMQLVRSGTASAIDRYVGYYEPYATSHEALDADEALFQEARNAARAVVRAIGELRGGRRTPDAGLESPRAK